MRECDDNPSPRTFPDPNATPCGEGEPYEGNSVSGASVYFKCSKHWVEYFARMREVKEQLDARYPGWDVPGSVPPAWFDPSYAGERWDDD